MTNFFRGIFLFVLLLNYGSTLMINREKEHNKFSNILDTVTNLANKEFNYRLQTVIVSKDIDSVIVDNFLKLFKGTVVIEVKRDGSPPEQVIIFLQSLKSFRRIMKILKPDLKGKSLLHSGAKFIIVLHRSHRFEEIFRILWSYYVTDVIIIAREKNMTALYTYYPYKNQTECQNTQPFVLGIVNKVNLSKVNKFPDKMENMQKCPLYLSTNKLYHSVGKRKIQFQIIMETLLQLLQNVMNFTPIIYTNNYVSINSDLSNVWADSLNDVIIGTANFSTCSISFGVDKLNLLDYSVPYFRMRIVWLAPPIKTGYLWLRLLSPLNGYMWLILLILMLLLKCFPLILRVKSIMRFSSRHFRGIRRLKDVAFRIWAMAVGQPVRVNPKRFRDFYIIGLWMWFMFVVRSAYQSVLIGALKTDKLVGQFASLSEAIENGYKFGGGTGVLVNFEHDPQIREDYEIIPDIRFEETLNKVLKGERKFVIAMYLEYAWSYCLSRGINENECGHILSESIMTVPLVVWVKKRSPLLKSLSKWLQRFIESGLLERGSIKTMAKTTSRTFDPTPLTIDETLSCFLCLIAGYILSIIIFCLEMLKVLS